jgi:hypothetical protein
MTGLKREATIRWLGNPPDSAPRLIVGSHSMAPLLSLNVDPEVTDPLATLPGELLAGAIGSVFTWIVAGITCQMSGRVAGVQETHLQVLAQAAMTQCIQRLGMRTEGIGVTVETSLEGS